MIWDQITWRDNLIKILLILNDQVTFKMDVPDPDTSPQLRKWPYHSRKTWVKLNAKFYSYQHFDSFSPKLSSKLNFNWSSKYKHQRSWSIGKITINDIYSPKDWDHQWWSWRSSKIQDCDLYQSLIKPRVIFCCPCVTGIDRPDDVKANPLLTEEKADKPDQ